MSVILRRRQHYLIPGHSDLPMDGVGPDPLNDVEAMLSRNFHGSVSRQDLMSEYCQFYGEEAGTDSVAFVTGDDTGSVEVPEPEADYYDADLSGVIDGVGNEDASPVSEGRDDVAQKMPEPKAAGEVDVDELCESGGWQSATRVLGQRRIAQYAEQVWHLTRRPTSLPRPGGDVLAAVTVGIGSQNVQTQIANQMPSRQLSYFWRSQILADSATKGKKYKSWKYKRTKQWNKNKQAILDLFSYFELWGASLKAIEGSFGSSVVSYFLFVRWLFLLNCFIFLCILSVIILPQALLKPKSFYNSIAMDNGSLMHYQEMAMICSKNYSDFLQESMNDDITAVVLDVFQGTGFLQDTYLFLGYYFNKTYFNDLSQPSFDMPLAHLATTAVYLLITLILMVRYTANGIKEKILSKGYHYHKTWSLVFCGWDYTLTKKKAASYKHISLRKEIQNVLLELELAERQRMMNAKQKACIYIKRIIINIITVGCLGGSFALIYFVIEVWKPQLQETVLDNDVLTLVIEYLPSVTITALNFCIPFIFSYLVILEEYSPSVELKVHLVRTVFLRLVSLITLAVTMFSVVACNGHEVSCGSCNEKIKCWETYIGQELYKLVILDFFIILGTTFLVEFPRKAIVTRVKKLRVFQQEFDLPVSVLNIVYSQTLSWWGAFYSPLIPGITIVKFFVLFYCKKVSLFVNQTPPHRPYQTSKSNHFFMMILMISFVLSVAALTYTAGWLIPSQGCGPFRVYIMEDYRLYHSLTALISTFPSVLRVIFTTMTSWLAYILLLVILSLVIDFLRAKAAGSERVINILRDQFALLEKDKKFLLDEVRQVPQL